MYIKTINSEIEVREDILRRFRENKALQQTAFYLGSGAENYYNISKVDKQPHRDALNDAYHQFITKHISKYKNVLIMSLGCGNSYREKPLLKAGKDYISYIGVDSSMSILKMAIQELSDLECNKMLWCADFGSDDFIETVKEETKDFDNKVFAFLGGTIGNYSTDFLADIMLDMMNSGEYLWLDVAVRESDDELTNRLLFEKYERYTKKDVHNDFNFYPLKEFGLNKSCGKFLIEMVRENAVNSLCFNIKFAIQKSVSIKYKQHHITLLPNTELHLNTIKVFSPEGLTNFFEKREFESIDQESKGGRGQFLFRKK